MSRRLPALSARQVIRALERGGVFIGEGRCTAAPPIPTMRATNRGFWDRGRLVYAKKEAGHAT